MKPADLIAKANKIVIIQADNPDGDSLSSSLALEQILTGLGKDPNMYCGVDIPDYLKYMEGWDRVSSELPKKFDLSIIVDNSSLILLENLTKSGEISWIKSKPCLIIDHHETPAKIDFANAQYIEPAVSTTELIYKLSSKCGWQINKKAAEFIVYGILSDSLGLTTENVTSESVKTVAQMMDVGVKLSRLEENRRKLSKKTPDLIAYKAELLKRIEYELKGVIAVIDIPWEEIEKYSQKYNPPMLVMDEMRQIEGVELAIAFKSYPDGRITAKLRSNSGFPYCDKVAESFGGGGHKYASGFRREDGSSLNKVKEELFAKVKELSDETL